MVDTLKSIVFPFLDVWNMLTVDPILSKLKAQPSGTSLGSDYVSKSLDTAEQHFNKETDKMSMKLYQESRMVHFLEDNWMMLSVLGGVDRLLTFRQSLGINKARYLVGDSNMGALQAFFNQGVCKGYFKGYTVFLFQQIAIRHHASQQAGSDWTKFFLYTCLYETLLYPLDTVKTIVQADVSGKHYKGYRQVVNSLPAIQLFRGLHFKLLYNGLFCLQLKSVYDQSSLLYLTTPLWMLGYALLNHKTKLQIADTKLSFFSAHNHKHFLFSLRNNVPFHQHFAGFLPFLLLNTCVTLTLPILYSEQHKESILTQRQQLFQHNFRAYTSSAERKWA